MAHKGGGAWKVAYADFVTAMMAFFLVMWIMSQDQKIRQAVARYFNNPMEVASLGTSKKPDRTGALFNVPSSGTVPKSQSVMLGHGRNAYTFKGEAGFATKIIGDWLSSDAQAADYWRKQARQARESARVSPAVLDKVCTAEEAAVLLLAKQLQFEMAGRAAAEAKGVHRDILTETLSRVNWTELAEDILAHTD